VRLAPGIPCALCSRRDMIVAKARAEFLPRECEAMRGMDASLSGVMVAASRGRSGLKTAPGKAMTCRRGVA